MDWRSCEKCKSAKQKTKLRLKERVKTQAIKSRSRVHSLSSQIQRVAGLGIIRKKWLSKHITYDVRWIPWVVHRYHHSHQSGKCKQCQHAPTKKTETITWDLQNVVHIWRLTCFLDKATWNHYQVQHNCENAATHSALSPGTMLQTLQKSSL